MLGKTLKISRIFAGLLCGGALILGGCASHHPKEQLHAWDNDNIITPPAPPPATEPQVSYAPPPPPPMPERFAGFTQTTNFAGCTGTFTLTDGRGRVLQSGRAFDAPEGLYLIDPQGRRSGRAINATPYTSLLFKPDCNCGNLRDMPRNAMPMQPQCNR